MSGNKYDIPQPNFIRDLEFGRKGERKIKSFLENIASGHLEVKTDRYRNGRMVIELEQKPSEQDWKPSGLMVTTAKWWVYQYGTDGAFNIISVDRMKRYVEAVKDDKEMKMFGTRGDNKSRGYLLEPDEVVDLMNNPAYDGKDDE
jgi:hypothetical protein